MTCPLPLFENPGSSRRRTGRAQARPARRPTRAAASGPIPNPGPLPDPHPNPKPKPNPPPAVGRPSASRRLAIRCGAGAPRGATAGELSQGVERHARAAQGAGGFVSAGRARPAAGRARAAERGRQSQMSSQHTLPCSQL
jgi:hypothetical protein